MVRSLRSGTVAEEGSIWLGGARERVVAGSMTRDGAADGSAPGAREIGVPATVMMAFGARVEPAIMRFEPEYVAV